MIDSRRRFSLDRSAFGVVYEILLYSINCLCTALSFNHCTLFGLFCMGHNRELARVLSYILYHCREYGGVFEPTSKMVSM